MGLAVAATVFAGFARSYYLSHWLTPPARTPEITPLLHIHAIVFTLWILLQVVQPALIAGGRVGIHRKLGWFGAALAVMVWLLGNSASIEAMKVGYKGLGDPYAFYAITFFSMQAFAIVVALGILRRGDGDAHKRLMLLSSAAILEAAVGRLPLQMVVDTAPLSFYLGADLIILAGILYDWRTRGRMHGVWIWGGGALVASQIIRVAVMNTGPWLAFAHAMARLT
ncbi:MAG TPA: hypothetical protein VF662_16035 [Allosphingosinicella sp.]|jgi:hypothetical protein